MSDRETESTAPGATSGVPGPFSETSAPANPGEILAGRWEILRLVGSGGSGFVYEAFDREIGSRVALKLLRRDRVTASALVRLRREVRLAREVESPRLVRVFEFVEGGGHPFLTMEFVEGEPLRTRIGDGLPTAEAVHVVRQILEGLAVLHARGIVHRDVKPGNVLVLPSGDVKLVDFGLARRIESDEAAATETDALVGTVEYISPEQALGRPLDERSDLYSVGILLYEMLTGAAPFASLSPIGTVMARLKAPAPDARVAAPGVPTWLAAVVARLLERDPASRYPSARAVLDDLDRARLSPSLFLRRWRRPLGAAAAAALLLAAGAALLRRAEAHPGFDHLVTGPAGEARAVDDRGRTLWSNPLLDPARRAALVRRHRGERPVLAAILLPADSEFDDPRPSHVLSWLDPDTGALLGTDILPNGADRFAGIADRYNPDKLDAADLDGNGDDEVVVSYNHRSDIPSYTVVFSPATGVSGFLFGGSGHHRFVGAVDVDGDGRKEAVLAGLNNALGWYGAIAVVRIPRFDTGTRESGAGVPGAWSPENTLNAEWDSLVDYVLLPRGLFADVGSGFVLDPAAATLTVPLRPRGPTVVSLSGCGVVRAGDPPEDCAARRKARRGAWDLLRAALGYFAGDEPRRAAETAGEADRAAEQVPDPYLAEAARRIRARALVAAGAPDEARSLFGTLYASSENAPEIADEAGKAFHLEGRLDEALAWYLRGTTAQGVESVGRNRSYMLDGALMVLCELGRTEQASSLVDRYASSRSGGYTERAEIWNSLLAWREGRRPEATTAFHFVDDTSRYWLLEFAVARREEPGRLLAAADLFDGRYSGPRSLALSVRAEILDRAGRREEAWKTIEEAWERGRAERLARVEARAHFDVLARRYVRLAEATGHPAEAAAARGFLKSVWGGAATIPSGGAREGQPRP